MLTRTAGRLRARAPRSVSSGSTRGRIAPTHVTTQPSTVPVRLSNHTGHSCASRVGVCAGGCALVTLRVTHLVYLVPVTKISTRTAACVLLGRPYLPTDGATQRPERELRRKRATRRHTTFSPSSGCILAVSRAHSAIVNRGGCRRPCTMGLRWPWPC